VLHSNLTAISFPGTRFSSLHMMYLRSGCGVVSSPTCAHLGRWFSDSDTV